MKSYTKTTYKQIEQKWQKRWQDMQTYKVEVDPAKPKYYILDMFPYPSGAGLHVGHPLGYIASDIIARYKRIKGFNVLHPIGFDAFGLPAEQYAIEHGVHPAKSTQQNIKNFREQLKRLGLSYDWSREVQTSDPNYYKWTQWIFLQFFNSWFNPKSQKAEPITQLIAHFEREGNINHPCPESAYQAECSDIKTFSAEQWTAYDEASRQKILMMYRLAYQAHTYVNWCEALGTVLANEEVINGVSYRGGHPIVKKKMRQWNLRITSYAERLLHGLENIDYSHAMKEMQRNWIGRSTGLEIEFNLKNTLNPNLTITVFTTRPDTIFGVDFLVLAPESEHVKNITSKSQKTDLEAYLKYVSSRSEIERMSEIKKTTGCFTGAYAIHPLSGKRLPIWVSEYVLIGYGTGAIMAVPCADERDHRFANHFAIPITNIIGSHYNDKEANSTDEAILQNSDFINGLTMKAAMPIVMDKLEGMGMGKRKINYKIRDAGWSRQRYWGEPFPIRYNGDIPYAMDENELPLELPDIDIFTPSGMGEGPLHSLKKWIHPTKTERRDANTMPTHAGAAWYFLRYTDPHNNNEFAAPEKLNYWNQVDVYIGGSEHAVAHLLYSRLVVKVLHDLGYLTFDEPFKKLINQGKIMGNTKLIYRIKGSNTFVSKGLKDSYSTDPIRVDISMVKESKLDIAALKKWKPNFADAEFILENGDYLCGSDIEKMSKSYFNVVNPDRIIENYGTDTLRMYEMFLGPLEQSKPWDIKGIAGVHKFIKRFWSLFYDQEGKWIVNDETPVERELKIMHKTIQKIARDIENCSFNTAVSQFMICTNELTACECHKKAILEPLTIALCPFAPYITEELWEKLGHNNSIQEASYPSYDKAYLQESTFEYPVSINGKVRTKMNFKLDEKRDTIEKTLSSSETIQKWLQGAQPKKTIIVPGKIINIVI